MTCGQLRALTLKSVTAACPVTITLATPSGPVEVDLLGCKFERVYAGSADAEGRVKKVLKGERLVILARAGETLNQGA